MNCTPQDVVTGSACYQCLDGIQDDVLVYLLCAWANGTVTPITEGTLADEEGKYITTDEGDRIILNL
jgi:hypothetical protein